MFVVVFMVNAVAGFGVGVLILLDLSTFISMNAPEMVIMPERLMVL